MQMESAEDMEALMERYQSLLDESDAMDADNYEVNIRLQLGNEAPLSIPDAAVQFGSQGTYVYVIDAEDTASVRNVVLGASSDGRIEVLEGLEEGERVVLEGIDRLRDGAKAEVVDAGGQSVEEADDEAAADGGTGPGA